MNLNKFSYCFSCAFKYVSVGKCIKFQSEGGERLIWLLKWFQGKLIMG